MNVDRIIDLKRKQLAEEKILISLSEMRALAADCERIPLDFLGAIRRRTPGIIAQVARQDDKVAAALALDCAKSGADALAVWANKAFFSAQKELFSEFRPEVTIPIVRCDYVIDPYQIYETLLVGADAVLLIAALVSLELLSELVAEAHTCGLQCIAAAGTVEEVDDACRCGADMVALLNGPLPSGPWDVSRTSVLIKSAPKDTVCISVGGISTKMSARHMYIDGAAGVVIDGALLCKQGAHPELNE